MAGNDVNGLVIPEPSTYVLLGLSLATIAVARRKMNKSNK
jgi:hypothetical protein